MSAGPVGAGAGTHLGAAEQLAWLRVQADPAGLVLGRSVERELVPVRLFREDPVRATLIGGWWLASLVAFRALAVGALVAVNTTAPDRWHPLVRAVQGSDRLAVMVGDRPVKAAASWSSPMLLIDDLGPYAPAARGTLTPWQTRLTVLPWLTPAGAVVAGSATLLMTQRLAPEEVGLLRMDDRTAGLIQAMHDDMVALVGGGANRYVWLTPTSVETHFFGAPHRSR
ncbi:hypothetical protein Dvina_30875 [Dactylosporangium vinaceum]|uniref:Uncharacterized protein n=1 Tax=Dactylosporangium vinaceum TaxID=53362 RepID=A0ABV5MJY0_9ACTN|nr:hypothetical protein [Dactylosporangium vinaceum]UAB92721.1 hypothetical protein Dvina_30875 [Dactylosporangium vinaceum]